jgi:hypothetical protein
LCYCNLSLKPVVSILALTVLLLARYSPVATAACAYDVPTNISVSGYSPATVSVWAYYNVDGYPGRTFATQCYYTLDGTSPKSNGKPFLPYQPVILYAPGTYTIRAGHYSPCTGDWLESSLTAIVTIQPYTVTTGSSIGGTCTGGGNYPPGSTAQLDAIPDNGWSFVQWTGASSSTNNPLDLSVSGNLTVTPIFASSVVIDQPSNGSISASTNISLLVPRTEVQFLPIPNPGYYFDTWGGLASGSAMPYKYVHTTANATISANFLPLPSTNVT